MAQLVKHLILGFGLGHGFVIPQNSFFTPLPSDPIGQTLILINKTLYIDTVFTKMLTTAIESLKQNGFMAPQ